MVPHRNDRDVDDEDLGIRASRVRRAKAVERAMERLRAGIGPKWSLMSAEDIEALERAFGELWSWGTVADWDGLRITSLKDEDVAEIIRIGRTLCGDHADSAALGRLRELIADHG